MSPFLLVFKCNRRRITKDDLRWSKCDLDLLLSKVLGMEPFYKVQYGISYSRCSCMEIIVATENISSYKEHLPIIEHSLAPTSHNRSSSICHCSNLTLRLTRWIFHIARMLHIFNSALFALLHNKLRQWWIKHFPSYSSSSNYFHWQFPQTLLYEQC